MKLIIVLLIAVIFIALAIINYDGNDFESDGTILNYDFDNCQGVFETGDGNLFFCAKNYVKFLNHNSDEKWSIDVNFSEPVISHDKKFLAMSDMKTNSIFVYSDKGELYSIKDENKLLAFCVNSSGYCSSISKDNSTYKINVYNPSGDKILTYVHSEENVFPVNTAVSPDGKILAISYIDTNNINIDSKITFMYTNQNDIFASVQKKDNFACGLNFLSNHDIIIVSDDNITCEYFTQNNLNEKWNLDFEKKLDAIDFNNDFIAVKLIADKSGKDSQSNIKFYNMSGKNIGEFKSDEQYNYFKVSAKNNCVMLGSMNDFIAVNTNGKILWEYNAQGEQKFAAFLDKPNKILFVSSTKAYIVNVKGKGE